jgi:hypothetical protein
MPWLSFDRVQPNRWRCLESISESMRWMVWHRAVELARLIRTCRTIGIISLLVAMSDALLSGREQMHGHSIETWQLTIMGASRVFRIHGRRIGEKWKPGDGSIPDDFDAFRLGVI